MLVLSRKLEEAIIIRHQGVKIRISIREKKGEEVKVCIEAPPEVLIVREEIDRWPAQT